LPASEPPASPITGPLWRALLEASADEWHSLYHLGLVRLSDGDREGARDAWTRSFADQPNAWAQRALAHLAGSPAERSERLVAAHHLQPDLRELTIETLKALLAADSPAEALDLISTLSSDDRAHGRIRLYNAEAAQAIGDIDEVRRLLDEGITIDNLQEGEASLDLLWLAAHPDLPVPPEYDFRMSGS
jgi:predicted Zn-dependent protease